jgi:pimeloyl-ACP methyl ester carboxylesterase
LPDETLVPAAAGGRDLRAPYREAACRLAKLDPAACDQLLRRESGEPPAEPAARAVPDLPGRYRIGFVPGLFAQCLAPMVRPFKDVEPALRAQGYAVAYFDVPGRGTVAGNARFISERIAESGADPRPFILVSYSKGLADVLEYLVNYPVAASRVAAVISMAGAANGSPLADALQSVYRDWVAALPLPWCETSSGDEILDLQRDQRREWWAGHRGRLAVPVFSLVTMPNDEQVSLGLKFPYRKLAEIDPRNDGKLLSIDQLVPGGYLLGYANADHWSIAVPLSQELPALAFVFRDDLPRPALVEAAIEVVARTLAADRQK